MDGCDTRVPSGDSTAHRIASSESLHAPVPLTRFHEPSVRGRGNRRRIMLGIICAALALAGIVIAGRCAMPWATSTDFSVKNLAPSLAHPFGTDQMGRDMLACTLAGLSLSLFVGLVASATSTLIALVLACVAAFGGRAGDAVVLWLIDAVMGLPHIVLLILISYALGRGIWGVTIGIALTHWPSLTRVLRAELVQMRAQFFLRQSAALGVGGLRLVATHLISALIPQLVVGAVLTFPHAILHEASITFLGFGLSPDAPAVGVILAESLAYLTSGMWWLAVLPGAALVACVLLFDYLGELLRRVLDARTVQE